MNSLPDKFGSFPDSNIVLMAIAEAYIQDGKDAASEFMSELHDDYSSILKRLATTIEILLNDTNNEDIASCRFYLVNFFGKDPNQYLPQESIKMTEEKCSNASSDNVDIIPNSRQIEIVDRILNKKYPQKKSSQEKRDEERNRKVDKLRAETNGHEFVDLGLSVLWATCNIGASKPEECGSYFAWGETREKREYTKDTYKFCEAGFFSTKILKYSNKDKKKILEDDDDAAKKLWGGEWRMPTKLEFEELLKNCTFQLDEVRNCYIITSNINHNNICLPIAWYKKKDLCTLNDNCEYWTSQAESTLENDAFHFDAFKYNKPKDFSVGFQSKWHGLPIRPVIPIK